jgi:class 3 adenylate cyclase/CheY-like chemotaxis protein
LDLLTSGRKTDAPVLAALVADDFQRLHGAVLRMRELLDRPESSLASAHGPPPEEDLAPETPVDERLSSASPNESGRILVVDDDAGNRDLLTRLLGNNGYTIATAGDGRAGLEYLRRNPVDLVISDLVMPGLDGLQLLREIRRTESLAEVAVVVTSGVDETDLVVKCLKSGAEDYVVKPFDPDILRTRVQNLMERKRYRDRERRQKEDLERTLRELDRQKREADRLLLNILPEMVARELVSQGSVAPKYFEDITVVTADFVSFTTLTERQSADELVTSLHRYFTAFDRAVQRYRLEKLKTVGDAYIYMAGIPDRTPSHPVDAILAAFEIIDALRQAKQPDDPLTWDIRVGVHTGPVIAGVVGIHKFAFDIWGDTVNLCDRLQRCGAPGRINVSDRTYWRIKDFFDCEPRGQVELTGNRHIEMFFVNGILPKLRSGGPVPSAFAKRYHTYFQREVPAFPDFLASETDASGSRAGRERR